MQQLQRPQTSLFIGIGAAIVVSIAAFVKFPYLHTNGLVSLLTIVTPLLTGITGALLVSRGQISLPAYTLPSIGTALGASVFALLVILVLPLFTTGSIAHDTNPFATTLATVMPTTTSVATGPAVTATTSAAKQLQGTFDNRGGADSVGGKATLGTTADGKIVLYFSELNATNGPDLYVYLSREVSPKTSTQVMNGIEVSKLKANTGSSTYDLPAGTDYTQFKSVVVFCKSFSAIFGYANFSA